MSPVVEPEASALTPDREPGDDQREPSDLDGAHALIEENRTADRDEHEGRAHERVGAAQIEFRECEDPANRRNGYPGPDREHPRAEEEAKEELNAVGSPGGQRAGS